MVARNPPTKKRTVIYVLIVALLAGIVLVAWRRACAAARRTKYNNITATPCTDPAIAIMSKSASCGT